MKTLVCVVLIFALVISGGVVAFIKINSAVRDFYPAVEKIKTAIEEENPDLLKTLTSDAISQWKNVKTPLCFLVNHEYIFEVDAALFELLAFSTSFDEAEATLSLSKVRQSLDCIVETSSFSIQNII